MELVIPVPVAQPLSVMAWVLLFSKTAPAAVATNLPEESI